MSAPSKDRQNPESDRLTGRLDGWKDIAAYLGKTDRTVKRWEAERGLPILRVPGRARGSVYAYPGELDDWLKSSNAIEVENSDSVKPQDLSNASNIATEAAAFSERIPDPQTDSSAPLTGWRRSMFGIRQGWAFALVALLLSGLAFAALRNPGESISGRVRSLFAKSLSGPVATSPLAVSDAQKMQARDLFLKGRYEWNQRTPGSLNRALDFFTQAVVRDPGYAEAYVGLADTYDLLREYTTMPDREAYSRAIVAAKRAVELDDSLADAHRALAYAEMYGAWDFADAEKEFRRAIELNPRDPEARRWYANAFAVPGRFQECLMQIEKARELDPASHATLADKGFLLFNAGRTEEAIATLKEVERSSPQFRSPHLYLMRISLYLKDYPTYLAEGQMDADSVNDPVLKDIMASARIGYSRDGERGLLNNLYAKQKQYYADGKIIGTTLARTCALMGKKQEALKVLEEAYARHEADMLSCLSNPDLLTLKDEPGYKALIKRINFPTPPAGSSQISPR